MSVERVEVTGRVRIPWTTKVNPLWWLQSDGANPTWTAPAVNNGQPYLPNIRNQLLRNVLWFCRNPAANLFGFVLGVEDRDYTAVGTSPVMATTGRDCVPPQLGWRWAVLWLRPWPVFLPYVSWYGPRVEFYLGWRPYSGGLGLKLVFPGGWRGIW